MEFIVGCSSSTLLETSVVNMALHERSIVFLTESPFRTSKLFTGCSGLRSLKCPAQSHDRSPGGGVVFSVRCTLAGDSTKDFGLVVDQHEINGNGLASNRTNSITSAGHGSPLTYRASLSEVVPYTSTGNCPEFQHNASSTSANETPTLQQRFGDVPTNHVSASLSSIALGGAWPGTGSFEKQRGKNGSLLGRRDESSAKVPGIVGFGSPGDFGAEATKLDSSSRVAIIGSGVSGIAACKALSEAGINVTVFEVRDKLGGIWSRTYPSTSLQTPRTAYRFSDWDWPADAPTNPKHDQVIEYLEGYVSHFGLWDKIQFNTRVASLQRPVGGRRGWRLRVQTRQTNEDGKPGEVEEQWQHFDFVVNCCGCFGDTPNIPKFGPGEGLDAFRGSVMHSAEYSGLGADGCNALLRGKRVVVVGFQKTAIDVAIEAAEANQGPDGQSCTLLFRKPHWLVPRDQLIFGIPIKYLVLTRFAELFHRRPNQSLLLTALQTALPLRSLATKLVEAYLCHKYPLRQHDLVPQHSFVDDLAACILPQMPPSFFPHVEAGRIQLARSPQFRFTPSGVELADGRQVAADVVLLCTGYDGLGKLKRMLPASYASQLSTNGQSIYLYRGVLHPRVPQMAFLGFHEGASSVHTSEMGARWLAKLLQGAFSLPSAQAMEEDRQRWWELKQTQSPFAGRVSCVVPIHSWHFDRLCKDMGWNPQRKKGLLAHWFSPHSSADYAEQAGDKQRAAGGAKTSQDLTEVAVANNRTVA